MPVFFRNFPQIEYDVLQDGNKKTATYLLRRFKPLDDILKKAVIYYSYDIKDGERPDIVSYKMYGTVDYDWIILMFNNKLDPFFSWPMAEQEFFAFLEDKYGSYEDSTQTIHHYEWITTPKTELLDGTWIPERTLTVDETFYETLVADERRIVYAFDYEVAKNEANRNIKILDSIYIPQLLVEKENIFNG